MAFCKGFELKIFCVANQKGGVGKTTTTVNLAAGLAAVGQRVLMVDLDPQGNATMGSGVDKRSLEASVYDVLLESASVAEGRARAEKGGYDLFMLKEIAEQPEAILNTLRGVAEFDDHVGHVVPVNRELVVRPVQHIVLVEPGKKQLPGERANEDDSDHRGLPTSSSSRSVRAIRFRSAGAMSTPTTNGLSMMYFLAYCCRSATPRAAISSMYFR